MLLAAVVTFAGLGVRGLWRQEARWAEIPREMMLSHDYFHPAIGGESYNDKPATSYWPVVLAARLIGRLDELAVRLPSAVAGLVLVACTLWLGRRLWSPLTGRLAALLLLSCFGYLQWARTGMPEMENAAAVLLAICWYVAHRDRPGFVAFLGFYLIMFVGALLKGLPAVILPLIAILPDLWSQDRWRRYMTPSHALAAAIGCVIYLAPFVYGAYTRTDEFSASGIALVFRENIVRFIRPFDHEGSVYLYLYYLPFLFLPWSPLLIAAIAYLVAIRRELDRDSRWLALAALLILVFFSLSGSRRSYYIIPLLPFCALLVAIFLTQPDRPRLASLRRAALAFQAVVIIAGIAIQLAGPLIAGPIAARWSIQLSPEIIRSMRHIGLSAAVGGLVVFALARLGRSRMPGIEALTIAAAVLMGGFAVWQLNLVDAYRRDRTFLQDVAARTTNFPGDAVAFYRTNSDLMLYYINRPVLPTILTTDQALRTFLAQPGPRAVITRRAFIADFDAAHGPPTLEEPDVPWSKSPDPNNLVAWVTSQPH